MVLEGRRIPEFSGALVTGKKPPFFVRIHVLHQVKLPVEALVTDLTCKHLPFTPDFCFLSVLPVHIFGFGSGAILCCVYIREEITRLDPNLLFSI